MASYRDFEKLWKQYQADGAKRDISIARYCKNHGIVYAHFERWYREYFRKKAYEVEIVNIPESDVVVDSKSVDDSETINCSEVVDDVKPTNDPKSGIEDTQDSTTSPTAESVTITKIDLRLSNGIEYHAEQITSSALTSLIEKLEAICLG